MFTGIRNTLAGLLLGAIALTGATALASDAKTPQTAEDHAALAKQYLEKATAYKAEADSHRQMAEEYKKSFVMPVNKAGQKNPYLLKMEKHCVAIAKEADRLAADTQKAAEYHELRAKELQGK